MTKRNNRAQSAQTETAKRVNNRRRAAAAKEVNTVVVEDVTVVDVETIETQTEDTAAVAGLPVATETETKSDKVTSNDALRAAVSLRAAVKEERRGANVTIRLIAERAAAGDTAAVDVLCALCDVPRAALFSLNIDIVRAAVKSWYPYYTETETRRVNVRAAGVWYTEKSTETQTEDAAAKRVKRGYRAAIVEDYLDQLIRAAKSRAKGITPRRVDIDTIYSDNKLSTAANGITAREIDIATERRAYSGTAANVWKRDRNGYYI